MKRCLSYILPFIVFILLNCAKTVEPVPVVEQKVYVSDISIEDIRLSEVWLNFNLSQPLTNHELVILANGYEKYTQDYSFGENLIQLNYFKAGTTYDLSFLVKDSLGNCIDSSTSFQIKTLEQPVYDFNISKVFIPDLDEFESEILFSIAMLNESNFYTVGDLRKDTGSGAWEVYSGLKYLNGSLNAMQIDDFIGDSVKIRPSPYYAAERIDGNLYLSNGNNIIVKSNASWRRIASFFELNMPRLTQIWGNSPRNIFLAGRDGALVRYDGLQIEQIKSSTETDIFDIWGSEKYNFVWFCTFDYNGSDNTFTSKVYQYDGESVKVLLDCTHVEGLNYVKSIWSYGQRLYLAGDSGFYHYDFLDEKVLKKTGSISDFYEVRKIRGINHNKIFGVGTVGVVYSYDGVNWKFETGYQLAVAYFDMDIYNKTVIATGISGSEYQIGIYTF